VTGVRGRRREQLLNGPREMREYCKLEKKALNCSVRRIRFRRGCRPVARQSTGLVLYLKSSPDTGLEWPTGLQEVTFPRFHDYGTGL
jgi:hypothetical protein